MTRAEEDEVLRRAVARGWIAAGDVARLDEELARDTLGARGPHGQRIELLLRRGLLDERSLAELTDRPIQKELTRLGRYLIAGRVGSGGAGTVYRAHDPHLGRDVALKVLHAASEEEGARILAEARAQARVDHEHVCKVFEAGEIDGRPTIVMQLVDGETLRAAAARMTLEQKVGLMAHVADAVHAAHKIGLIHRDIKPTNIMVEADGKPYVMDFGLARDVDASLSASGSVVGTPPYMSPEQARGETRTLDRRTDVYSLGATLYEVLTGRPPFSGETGAAVLLRVLSDDPVSLRRLHPGVPMDLETVALKCLEKDPARRYESARALAEDLRRYLDGEPVAARRASFSYRMGKRLRKNKVAAASMVLAVVALLAAAALVARAQLRAANDAETARRYGEEAKSIETMMRMAALAPLHDTRPERRQVRERMALIERELDEQSDAGRAAGLYALGRGHLALGEPAAARRRLAEAWALGDHRPQVALALGEAIGALAHEESDRARLLGTPEEQKARLAEIRATLGKEARNMMAWAHGATLLESTAYTQALIEHYEGRHEEAAAAARKAGDDMPWLFEARRLEGDALRQLAEEAFLGGRYERVVDLLGRAGERYGAALAVGRSDAATHRAEFHRRSLLLDVRLDRKGGATADDFGPVRQAFEAARLADPGAKGLYVPMASTELQMAIFQKGMSSGDPMPAISRALVYATLEPDDADSWQVLGLAYWVRGSILGARGEDPLPSYRSAVGAAERTIAMQPGSARAYNTAGIAWRAIAEHEQRHGQDPRPSVRQARAAYRKVTELNPAFVGVWTNLGRALSLEAEYDLEHGLDADESVTETVAAYRKAADLDNDNFNVLNGLGNAFHLAAKGERAAGRDPRPLLQQADAQYRRSREVNPRHPFALGNLGGDALLLAQVDLEDGHDPRPALTEARARYGEALELSPAFGSGLVGLALASSIEALFLADRGDDPTEVVARGRAELARARPVKSDDPRLPVCAARLALAEALRGRDAARAFAAALDELGKAQAAAPGVADYHAWEAEVRMRRAGPGDREQGLAAANRALAINPRHEVALRARNR